MTAVPFYQQWVKTDNSSAAINFFNCSLNLQKTVYNKYINLNGNSLLDPIVFGNYFRKIEEWFNCSGFCYTVYYSNTTNTSVSMYKYLFSDINR
jgi:hypothetical protein